MELQQPIELSYQGRLYGKFKVDKNFLQSENIAKLCDLKANHEGVSSCCCNKTIEQKKMTFRISFMWKS